MAGLITALPKTKAAAPAELPDPETPSPTPASTRRRA